LTEVVVSAWPAEERDAKASFWVEVARSTPRQHMHVALLGCLPGSYFRQKLAAAVGAC
jgi:hypothetical protein